jgi:hypothetical protein
MFRWVVCWAVCAVMTNLCAQGVLRGSMEPDGLVRRGWVRCDGLYGAACVRLVGTLFVLVLA